jgi:hypothetical protein
MSASGMTKKNILQENTRATSGLIDYQRSWNRHKKLCWACQKDKVVFGGRLTNSPGFSKFVCSDCCGIAKAKKEGKVS